MKKLFSKTNFREAPGGNLYEFKDAETSFEIQKDGFYVIKVVSSAKNAKQNNTTDDDDLRMTIDGYGFGKYEQNTDQLSWKGFNTSASWNGANLNGKSKTVYFFVNLDKSIHTIKFYADNYPVIQSMEIYEIENNHFNLNKGQNSSHESYVFLNTYPKELLLISTENLDSKLLHIIINGKKLAKSEISDKLLSPNVISLSNTDIIGGLPFENTVEIVQEIANVYQNFEIHFSDTGDILSELQNNMDFKKIILTYAWWSILYFKLNNYTYSAKFLEHALHTHPETLIFKANHPLVSKVKSDPAFNQIILSIKHKIDQGYLRGEILPHGINFVANDFAYAIHGIKKIEYNSTLTKEGSYHVNIILYDIYDFDKIELPTILNPFNYLKTYINNYFDFGEEFKIINNFEIQIYIKITL